MEIQVKYTITTAYVFDEDEVAREHPEENDIVELAEQWI